MNDSALFGMLGLLIGGAGVWAVMRARVSLASAALLDAAEERDSWIRTSCESVASAINARGELVETRATISRLSDTVGQLQDKRDRALECVTEGSAHVGKKMARILNGDL